MIGLLFLFALALWLWAAIALSRRFPHWIGKAKHAGKLSVLVFPFVLVAPVADEFIGGWQFDKLCEKADSVQLSPEWKDVHRAGSRSLPPTTVAGHINPTTSSATEYFDIDTGRAFLTTKSFHSKGGVLARNILAGLDNRQGCYPDKNAEAYNYVGLQKLLDAGTAARKKVEPRKMTIKEAIDELAKLGKPSE